MKKKKNENIYVTFYQTTEQKANGIDVIATSRTATKNITDAKSRKWKKNKKKKII